ncbi:MAG: TetR/AcrR family transcriptional regulator [Kiritimatiellia bacterium]
MPKIDHSERRRHIVSESVKLFADYGYAQVNFGMIAKASGVARTLIYRYFKNKRAIFNEAINEVTDKVRDKYPTAADAGIGADQKLRRICITVLMLMFANRRFVCVIADVLSGYRRKGGSIPVERVIAHTSGLLHVLQTLIAEGVSTGEYRAELNPQVTANLIYSQYEATALRMAITGNAELSVCLEEMEALLRSLRA